MKSNHRLAMALTAGAVIGGALVQGLHAQTKPPVYVVTEITVSNPEAYRKEYVPKAPSRPLAFVRSHSAGSADPVRR
jgi:hypothetical protein